MDNLQNLIPKDKFDLSTIDAITALSDSEIDEIYPILLTWLQDMNWPVSEPMAGVLASRKCVAEKHILKILPAEQNDDIWKYNIITYLLSKWPELPSDPRIVDEIKRIALRPTDGERDECVADAAEKYLTQFNLL
ncbi:MAG: DUF5071 domain-containing protein [Clostridiales bacterium]|nr:DUF5071 domain-containing protein [Clostridiales bacterium]